MERRGFLGALAALVAAPKLLVKQEPEAVVSGFPPIPDDKVWRSGYAHVHEDQWGSQISSGDSWSINVPSFVTHTIWL